MRVIRSNLFETNSSSMHSIVIMKKSNKDAQNVKDGIWIWKDGVWDIDEDDLYYGRYPFRILGTFADKVKFAIASFCGSGTEKALQEENLEKITKIVQKYIPELVQIKLPINTDYYYRIKGTDEDVSRYNVISDEDSEGNDIYYVFDENGNKKEVTEIEESEVNYGLIDYDYSNLLERFLAKYNISLEDFLVDYKYLVVIDGDEYHTWEKYKKVGIINTDEIDVEY